MHEQLLIRVALQLRLSIQPLIPCFLDDFGTAARVTLIERVDCTEVDLLIYVVLESWGQVVGMIVGGSLRVVVTVVPVFVVAMRHDVGDVIRTWADKQRGKQERFTSWWLLGSRTKRGSECGADMECSGMESQAPNDDPGLSSYDRSLYGGLQQKRVARSRWKRSFFISSSDDNIYNLRPIGAPLGRGFVGRRGVVATDGWGMKG